MWMCETVKVTRSLTTVQKIFQLASGSRDICHFVEKKGNFFVAGLWQCVDTPATILSTQNACWHDNSASTQPTAHPDGGDRSKSVQGRRGNIGRKFLKWKFPPNNNWNFRIFLISEFPRLGDFVIVHPGNFRSIFSRRPRTLLDLSPPSGWAVECVDT